MKNLYKSLMAATAVVALATAAQAVPSQGLIISDGVNSITLSSTTGIIQYNSVTAVGPTAWNAADKWNIVVTTGTSFPPLLPGNPGLPTLDLSIQATSLGGAGTLSITFFGTDFGPTSSGKVVAHLTGQAITGTAGTVHFNTFFSTLNAGATTTALTASGALPGANYENTTTAGGLTGSLYSMTEVVTIDGANGAKYSLDASATTVPDGGTTLVLLGSALSGLALLRKKIA